MKVDIAIMTIREDEFTAVRRYFKTERRQIPGGRTYLIGEVKTDKQTYTIAIARCSEQGNDASQRLAHYIIQNLDPQLILVVGIAGGTPHDDFTLGDVVVSTRIVNPNVDAWQADGTTEYMTRGGPAHPWVEDIVSLLPGEPQLAGWADSIPLERPDLDPEQASIKGDDEWCEKVLESLDWHFGEEQNRGRAPLYTIGPILSSNHLIKDPARLRDILKAHRSVLAVEMEAAGVYDAAYGTPHYPVIAIRGISDIVGLQRDRRWTAYACQAAAALTYAFIMTTPIDLRKGTVGPRTSAVVSNSPFDHSASPQLLKGQQEQKLSQSPERGRTNQVRFPEAFPPLWNVPYRQNPFFTSHEPILKRLHDHFQMLRPGMSAPIQAITGPGGVGKTQTATEYAFRYRTNYQQAVLWVRADSKEALVSDFLILAGPDLLNIPEQNAADQNRIISGVKYWLREHTDWLLILDNADDLTVVNQFLPPAARGHILLTTRALATGDIAQGIEVELLKPEEGALFLLQRAKITVPGTQLDRVPEDRRAKATIISQYMDGLPLALDQAGAYIEETKCGLQGYLNLYVTHRPQLMKERGGPAPEYTTPVATAWTVSREHLQKTNPAAAELLCLCAFLYPDAIPEEILTKGTPDLGLILQPVAADAFTLNTVLKELRSYSLLDRDPDTQTLTIHRLIQIVLKDEMDQGTQRLWAERAVRAVNRAFPQIEVTTWDRCQQYLPQVQACTTLIDQWGFTFREAAQLLQRVGLYLYERQQYDQAQPFYQRARSIFQQIVKADDPELLALQGQYADLLQKMSQREASS